MRYEVIKTKFNDTVDDQIGIIMKRTVKMILLHVNLTPVGHFLVNFVMKTKKISFMRFF